MPDHNQNLQNLLIKIAEKKEVGLGKQITPEYVKSIETKYNGDYDQILRKVLVNEATRQNQDTNLITDDYVKSIGTKYGVYQQSAPEINTTPQAQIQESAVETPKQGGYLKNMTLAGFGSPGASLQNLVSQEEPKIPYNSEQKDRMLAEAQKGKAELAGIKEGLNRQQDKLQPEIQPYGIGVGGSPSIKAYWDLVFNPEKMDRHVSASEKYNNLAREKGDYTNAIDQLTKAEKLLKVGNSNSLGTAWQGATTPLLKDFATAGINEIGRQLDVLGSARKLQNGEKLSDSEEALMETFQFLNEVQSNTDLPLTAKGGQAIAEMIPYMVQFGATSGVGTAAKAGMSGLLKAAEKGAFKKVLLEAAREGGEKALAKKAFEIGLKQVPKKLAAYTAGAAAQAAVMPMGITNVTDRMIGTVTHDENGNLAIENGSNESFGEALGKGYTNTFAETFGENAMGGLVRNGAKSVGRMFGRDLSKIDKFFNAMENPAFVKNTMGVGNVLEEFGEEHITALIQNTVEGDWKSFYTLENQLVLGMSVLGMQGAFSGGKFAAKGYGKLQENKMYNRAESNFNKLPDEVKQAAQVYVAQDSPTSIAKGLSSLYNQGVINDEHKQPIIDYVLAKSYKDSKDEFTATKDKLDIVRANVKQNIDSQYSPFVNHDEDLLTSATLTTPQGEVPVYVTANVGNTSTVIGEDGVPQMVASSQLKTNGSIQYSSFVNSNIENAVNAINEQETAQEENAIKEQEASENVIGNPIEYKGENYIISQSNPDGMLITKVNPDGSLSDNVEYLSIDEANGMMGNEIQTEQTKAEPKSYPLNIGDQQFEAIETENGLILAHETTDRKEANKLTKELNNKYEGRFTAEVNEEILDPSNPLSDANYTIHLRPVTNEQNTQGQQTQADPIQQKNSEVTQENLLQSKDQGIDAGIETFRTNEKGKVIPYSISKMAGITPETENHIQAFKDLREKLTNKQTLSPLELKIKDDVDTAISVLEEQQGIIPDTKKNLQDQFFQTGRMDETSVNFYQNETPENMAMDIIQNLGTKDSLYNMADFPVFKNEGQLGIIQENIKQHQANGSELLPDAKKALDYFAQSIKERRVITSKGERTIQNGNGSVQEKGGLMPAEDLEEEILVKRLKNIENIKIIADELFGDKVMNYKGEISTFIDDLLLDDLFKLYDYANTQRKRNNGQKRSDGDIHPTTVREKGSEQEQGSGTSPTEPAEPTKPRKKQVTPLQRRINNLLSQDIVGFDQEVLMLIAQGYKFDRNQFIRFTGYKGRDLFRFEKFLSNDGIKFDVIQESFENESSKMSDESMDVINRAIDILTSVSSRNQAVIQLENQFKIDPNQGLSQEEIADLQAERDKEESMAIEEKKIIDEVVFAELLNNDTPELQAWFKLQDEEFGNGLINNEQNDNKRGSEPKLGQQNKGDNGDTRGNQIGSSKDVAEGNRTEVSKNNEEPTYGTKNKIVSSDRYEELKKKMQAKRGNLNSGVDPELMAIGAEMAMYHFEAGARKFSDFSKQMIKDLGDWISPYLKSFYEMARYMPNMEQYENELDSQNAVKQTNISNLVDEINVQLKKESDVSDRPNNSQRDSQNSTNEVSGNQKNVSNDRGTGNQERNEPSPNNNEGNRKQERGESRDNDTPLINGKQSNNNVSELNEEKQPTGYDARDTDGRGRGIISTEGVDDNEQGRSESDHRAVEKVSGSFAERVRENLKRQKQAENIPAKLLDKDNIRETLPFLLSEQQDDVIKAETRFFSDTHKTHELANGKGILFTNGTGTGKTYTGLGIVKRFTKMGKSNILILTPSQPKVSDWANDGKNLNLSITPLDGINDGGTGIVVSTYANFRANDALKDRDFDLIIYDESHRIMEAKGGKTSSTTYSHFEHSNVSSSQALSRITSVHPFWIEQKRLIEAIRNESNRPSDMMEHKYRESIEKEEKLNEELKQVKEKQKEVLPKLEERAKKAYENTKVVFLSATPFKEHFNLKYANGILFEWGNETTYESASRGMSRVDAESRFFLDNFGSAYEWKFHRLQQKTDRDDNAVSMQEIEFAKKLMAQGVMSGRAIESEQDYERLFPKVTGGFNSDLINEAYSKIFNYETKEFEALREATRDVFHSYEYTTQLLEALKASTYIPRIKKHLELGRKVVLFHRRQKSEVAPPFKTILDVTRLNANAILNNTDSAPEEKEKARTALGQCNSFASKFSDLLEYEQTLNYSSAVNQMLNEFGDRVVFINGKVTSKTVKSDNIRKFNEDGSGVDIIMVQEESGKEGISLHDTSGKHQRVLASLSMPISSTTALQIEGRTYRIGQETDAIFEYPLLGLDLEVIHFAQNINKKLSTTENLAIGDQARDLIRSFSEGVLFNSTTNDPSSDQGKGGKELDKREKQTFSEFQRAIMIYNSNQKKRGSRDNREGVDYFATPEPLGQKMMEWANLKEFESVMEPSSGHGAIAMWAPNNVSLTAIEPSVSLYSKLSARAGGGKQKIINSIFEDYNIINKYNAVVMNPPFGQGGSLAIKHVEKAFIHLKDGGRIVALIPNGGSMQKHLDKFLYGEDEKGKLLYPSAVLVKTIELPSVTFTQAGTQVSTKIVIIDKVNNEDDRVNVRQSGTTSLSDIKDIKDLFSEIEYLEVPKRPVLNSKEVEQAPRVENKPTETLLKDVEEFKHTKTGKILFNVIPNGFLGDKFYDIKPKASKYNGTWSRFTKGFLFDNKEDADKFKNDVDGISTVNEAKSQYGKKADTFYSPTEKALENIQVEKATPEQWKAQLEKNGAKQAELDWMGWDEFVKSQGIDGIVNKTINKQAIQDWINENKIEIKEVEKGVITKVTEIDIESVRFKQFGSGSYVVKFKDTDLGSIEISTNEALDEMEAIEVALDRANYDDSGKIENKTKYSQYQSEGGSNYKELLLTMPVKKVFDKSKLEIKRHISTVTQGSTELIYDGNNLGNYSDDPKMINGEYKQKSDSEWIEYAERAINFGDNYNKIQSKNNFKSTHFDEPNIVAHVRFNEKTDVNGNKVLFLEEIQSDFAQEGKKKGFDNPSDRKRINELADLFLSDRSKNKEGTPERIEYEKLVAKNTPGGVPDMPFKQTPQWTNLVLRRMMKYAADNGFDSVAWTNGQTQADRYDLSKQIGKINAIKDNNGVYQLGIFDKKNNIISQHQDVNENDLSDFVGKELSEKIIALPQGGAKVFSGLDLKVGGEGMIAFYDKIVPSQAKKVGKPFGSTVQPVEIVLKPNTYEGASSSSINMETGEVEQGTKNNGKTMTVLSMPVTTKMIEGVKNGVQLFEPKNGYDSEKSRKFEEDEINKAYGNARLLQQATSNTVRDTRAANENFYTRAVSGIKRRTVIDGFEKSGSTNVIGTKVRNVADIADLWSIHRSPYIEKAHVIFVKDGVIVGTTATTFNRSDRAQFARPSEIIDLYKKFGANGMYYLHNHPSGNHTASTADIHVTHQHSKIYDSEGINLISHIIIDHDKFSVIDIKATPLQGTGERALKEYAKFDVKAMEYKNAVPKLFSEREKLTVGNEQNRMMEIAKALLNSKGYNGAVVYLTPNLTIAAYDVFPDGADERSISDIIDNGIKSNLGSQAVVIHNGDYNFSNSVLNSGVLDVINTKSNNSEYFETKTEDRYTQDDVQTIWERKSKYGKKEDAPFTKKRLEENEELRKEEQANKVMDKNSRIKAAVFDNKKALKNFQERIVKLGGNLKHWNNAYMAENLSHSKVLNRQDAVRDNIYDPLVKLVAKISSNGGVSAKSLFDYLIAKHAPERNKYFADKEVLELEKELTKEAELRIDKQLINETTLNAEQMKAKRSELMLKETPKIEKQLEAKRSSLYDAIEKGTYNKAGMTNEKANELVDWVASRTNSEDIQNLHRLVKALSEQHLNYMKEYSLINKETFDNIKGMYSFYVPLRGWDKTADSEYIYRNTASEAFAPSKVETHGRSSYADNPIANLMNMIDSVIVEGEKNNIKLTFKRFLQANKAIVKDFASFRKMYRPMVKTDNGWEPVSDANGEIVEFENRNDAKLEQYTTDPNYKIATVYDTSTTKLKTSKKAKDHEVIVYDNGELNIMQLNDPEIAMALNNKDFNGKMEQFAAGSNQTVGKLTRFMSSMFTSRNPNFIVPNMTRDYMLASTVHYVRGGVKDWAKFQKNYVAIQKALMLGADVNSNNKYIKMYALFKEFGGETGYVHLKDPQQFKKELEADIKRIQGHIGKNAYKYSIGGYFTVMDKMAAWSENMSRFATFVTSVENGSTYTDAAFAAKNVTVNFNKKGRISGVIGAFYAFFNASVQSISLYGNLWQANWKRMMTAHVFYMSVAFMSRMLMSALRGDDDDEDIFDKISDFTKSNHLIIPFGKGDRYAKIPMPHAFRTFHGLGNMAFEVYEEMGKLDMMNIPESEKKKILEKMVSEKALNFIGSLPQDFLPIDVGGLVTEKGEFNPAPLVPTSIRPLAEYTRNLNFMGAPIYNEPFAKGSDRADSQNYFKSVNPYIRKITDKLYVAGGGNLEGKKKYTQEGDELKKVNPVMDINPEFIEHMFQGYLGGSGTFIKSTTQTMASVIGNEEIVLDEIPLVQRFVGNARLNKDKNEFYKTKDEMRKRTNAMKGDGVDFRRKNFTSVEQQKWAREINMVKHYEKQLEHLYDKLEGGRNYETGKPLSESEIKYIESEIKKITKEANSVMN